MSLSKAVLPKRTVINVFVRKFFFILSPKHIHACCELTGATNDIRYVFDALL